MAVGIGIFGLAGYLLVLYAFAKPLFGHGEYRRLGYVVWGYIGFGATVPSLYDRSVWAVVALSAVAMTMPARGSHEDPEAPADSAIPLPPAADPARLGRRGQRPAQTPTPTPS